jgi:hypothetical protein
MKEDSMARFPKYQKDEEGEDRELLYLPDPNPDQKENDHQ